MDVEPLLIKEKYAKGLCHRSKMLTSSNGERITCLGVSGSGKTYFCTSVVAGAMLHEPYGGCIIVCKNENQDSYKTLENWCRSQDIVCCITNELTKSYTDLLFSNKLPKTLIFDDLMDFDDIELLKMIFKAGRHFHITPICLCQDYSTIDKNVRSNSTKFIVFPLGSPAIARSVISGLQTWTPIDKDQMKKAYKFIVDNKHSCMWIDCCNPEKSCIIMKDRQLLDLQNFEPLTLQEDEEKKKITYQINPDQSDTKMTVIKDKEKDKVIYKSRGKKNNYRYVKP